MHFIEAISAPKDDNDELESPKQKFKATEDNFSDSHLDDEFPGREWKGTLTGTESVMQLRQMLEMIQKQKVVFSGGLAPRGVFLVYNIEISEYGTADASEFVLI